MRLIATISALFLVVAAFGAISSARADIVGTATLNDINGDGLPDLSAADAILVNLDYDATGMGGPSSDAFWQVSVNGGTAFREFFFNFDTALNVTDVVAAGANASSWTSIDGPTPAAGTFGQFGFRLSAGSTDLTSLLFTILVDGNFEANGTGSFFAAKIASSAPGGFVGADSISAVPLPAAAWIFISGIAGIGALLLRRRKLLASNQL